MPINFFQLEEIAKKVHLSLENTEKELFHNVFLYLLFNFKKLKNTQDIWFLKEELVYTNVMVFQDFQKIWILIFSQEN